MVWRHLSNQLIQGARALQKVGMPPSHAPAFMQIATSRACVISSRELGIVGTGLVEEGYDSKGFRIKSKTCNFGPMAGFVCTNPNYSKRGVAYAPTQQRDIDHALKDDDKVGWRGSVEHICISQKRLDWLRGEPSVNVITAPLTRDGTVLHGRIVEPAPVVYVLRRQPHAKTREVVWHLYTVGKETELGRIAATPALQMQPWDTLRTALALKPIEALVNPYPAYPLGHYKNCVCGDYDLFGVWPRRANYDPMGEDRRIAGMLPGQSKAQGNARNQQIFSWEDKRLGNINNRVHMVGQMINSVLPPAEGAIGGRRDMVHHSDEAGRPMVTEVELPVIAFIPPGPGRVGLTVAAENIAQMRSLVALCDILGFQVILNAGWVTQLSAFGAVPGTTGDSRGWQTPHGDPGRAQ